MADEPAKGDVEVVEPTALELAHARRVAEVKATVPHAYFDAEATGNPSSAELVLASATALADFPRLNGSYRDGRFELHSRINVGVAVVAEGGLVYPTIHDANRKSADAIAGEIATLGERAGAGAITAPELSGATFSVADLGPLGLSRAQLAVNRGQAAILTAGARGEATTLSLACDNRIVQAPEAAKFLARLAALIDGGA